MCAKYGTTDHTCGLANPLGLFELGLIELPRSWSTRQSIAQLQRPGRLPLRSSAHMLALMPSTQAAADRKVGTRSLQCAREDAPRSTFACTRMGGLARGIPDLENAGTTANQTYRVLQLY